MQNRTFNVYEAARELGCTSQWIRVLLAEQRLGSAHKIDGQWRIPKTALEALKQRREPVEELRTLKAQGGSNG